MRRSRLLLPPPCLPWALFLLAVGSCLVSTEAQLTVKATRNALVINTANSTIQVYPPVDVQPTDYCPDASWKHWKLQASPPNYDPLHWTRSQWKDYIVKYPLRSSSLSIAFLLIGLSCLLVAVIWRLVQWCVSCGHCQRACGAGTQDTAFLTDTKHRYLKAWIFLLIAAALGMVVWGMLAMDRTLISTFWETFTSIMEHGQNIADDMEKLQTDITQEVPNKLRATATTVNDTIIATRLGGLVKSSIDFSNNTKVEATSLLADSRAMRSGVSAGVLPGVAFLADQYGKPVNATATTGRRLAQSSPASYDTLYGLVPALINLMPPVASASVTMVDIHGKLVDLQRALAAFQTSPAPSSSDVAKLAAAVAAAPLGSTWEQQLAKISAGLQVYNASRTGPALTAAKDAADKIVSGSASASPSALAGFQARVTSLSRNTVSSQPYLGLKALREHLLNISAQVASVSDWGFPLANGTKIGVLDMATLLLGSLASYVTGDTNASVLDGGSGAVRVVNVSTFVQVARNASSAAAGLGTAAGNVSSSAGSARNDAAAGPNPRPAAARIDTTLRPSLSAASGPVGRVAAALAAYGTDPSAINMAELRAAVANATGPVGTAAGDFAVPLPDVAGLASACQSLEQSAKALLMAGLPFTNTALAYTYDNLTGLSMDMVAYEAGLRQLVGVLEQLPNPTDASDAVTKTATDVQSTVTVALDNVSDRVAAAADGLGDAISDLEDKLLDPGNKIIDRVKSRTDNINRIAYPVAMGAWGLGALLLLGLSLAVFLNWPAGLVGFGLALLAYLTLSQVVTSVLSFGLAVVDDACGEAELVLMRQMVEHANSPRMAIPLSHYLYNVPSSTEVMLQAGFDLNVSDVRLRLASINQTLSRTLEEKLALSGATAALVSSLRALGDSTRIFFDQVMDQLKYDIIHGLYARTKSVVCCDAGDFVYHQWCAITAAAALGFGALVSAAYLLLRMDMVAQRRQGCCSCFSCACYRPRGRRAVYGAGAADTEAGKEDKFAKEARKQHDEKLRHLHLHYPSVSPNPTMAQLGSGGYGAGNGNGNGEFQGVGRRYGDAGSGQPLPSSFASAAGGAAAAAALSPTVDLFYSAPPPTAMAADRQQ